MTDGLNQLAKGIGKAIETVPDLYEDAFQPTVQETGRLVSRIPRAINAAFSGLDKWILNKEYSIDETKKLLSQKLENVEPEKIVEPEPYVAIPAIQAISYSMNSNELRDLYANLLAKAMNTDTKESVHPAYIETIKQLSPEDAAYFKHIYVLKTRPLIDVKLELPNSLTFTIAENSNLFSMGYVKNFALSLDNLCRLGLVRIPNGIWYGDDSIYEQLLSTVKTEYTLEKYKHLRPDATEMSFEKKRIDITDYGTNFYTTCVI